MLIKGDNLTPAQVAQVKAAFLYRWTIENSHRAKQWQNCPTIPLQTDAVWISQHAFHFVKDGSRLSCNCRRAEPAYFAD